MCPFPGDIKRTPGKHNQVELYATGGSFRNKVIIISNVRPNDTIEEETPLRVCTQYKDVNVDIILTFMLLLYVV